MANINVGTLEAVLRLRDELSPVLKSVEATVKQGVVALGAIGAAAIASFGLAVKAATDYGGRVADLAAKTGLAVEAIQKLGFAAKLGGADMETAARAVGLMQKQLVTAMQAGDGKDIFSRLGLSVRELVAMKPDQAFIAVAESVKGLGNATEQTAAAMEAFGRGGAEMLPAIKNGLAAAAAEAERLGFVMDATAVAATDKLGDSMDTAAETVMGLVRNLGAVVAQTPAVHAAIGAFTTLVGQLSNAVKANQAAIMEWVKGGVLFLADAMVVGAKGAQLFYTGLAAIVRLVMEARTAFYALAMTIAEVSGVMAKFFSGMANNPAFKIGSPVLAANAGSAANVLGHLAGGGANAEKQYNASIKKLEEFAVKEAAVADAVAKVVAGAEALNVKITQGADLALDLGASFDGMGKTGALAFETVERAAAGSFSSIKDAIAAANLPYLLQGSAANLQVRPHQQKVFGPTNEELGIPVYDTTVELVDATERWRTALGGIESIFGLIGGEANRVFQSIQQGISGMQAGYQQFANGAMTSGPAGFLGMLGGGASMIGAGIQIAQTIYGALSSILGGDKGAEERRAQEAMMELQRNFIELQGGIDTLASKAEEAGVSLQAMFDAKNATEMSAAIDQIQRQLDTFDEAYEALADAMERYGIEASQLGPQAAQHFLDQDAGQLLKDFELLKAAGVDLTVIIEKMGPALNEYVQASMAAGTKIPEAMRPVIEQMLEAGLLTDEAGNKLETLDGVTFGETTSAFDQLIAKITELVNALLGIPTNINVNTNFTQSGAVPHPNAPNTTFNEQHSASGYSGMVHNPTWFLAGEAGSEHVSVTPMTGAGAGMGGGGGVINFSPTVNAGPGASGDDVIAALHDAITTNEGQIRALIRETVA